MNIDKIDFRFSFQTIEMEVKRKLKRPRRSKNQSNYVKKRQLD